MISSRHVRIALAALGGGPAWRALALLALLWEPGSAARADIIFSNFGPNNSYDTTNGYAFGLIEPNTVQDLAVFFRVGSQAATLQEIDVAMGYLHFPSSSPTLRGVE